MLGGYSCTPDSASVGMLLLYSWICFCWEVTSVFLICFCREVTPVLLTLLLSWLRRLLLFSWLCLCWVVTPVFLTLLLLGGYSCTPDSVYVRRLLLYSWLCLCWEVTPIFLIRLCLKKVTPVLLHLLIPNIAPIFRTLLSWRLLLFPHSASFEGQSLFRLI